MVTHLAMSENYSTYQLAGLLFCVANHENHVFSHGSLWKNLQLSFYLGETHQKGTTFTAWINNMKAINPSLSELVPHEVPYLLCHYGRKISGNLTSLLQVQPKIWPHRKEYSGSLNWVQGRKTAHFIDGVYGNGYRLECGLPHVSTD